MPHLPGALKAPGGQRYSLPSLYCVAAGRGFWSAAGAASAGLGTSPGEALVAGVVGPAPGVVGGPRAPLPVKAMPEEVRDVASCGCKVLRLDARLVIGPYRQVIHCPAIH